MLTETCRKIQLDCASAFWHKHHAEVVDPCGKKDEDKANVSYTMYCEVRDRANALGLQDDHRWMLHLDFHISFIEIRYLKEFDKAKLVTRESPRRSEPLNKLTEEIGLGWSV